MQFLIAHLTTALSAVTLEAVRDTVQLKGPTKGMGKQLLLTIINHS